MWSNVEWKLTLKLTLLSFCKHRWKLYGSELLSSQSNYPSDEIRFMCFPLFYIFRSPSTWNMHLCITCREHIYADTLSLSCFFSHGLLVLFPINFASLLLLMDAWVFTSNSVSCPYVHAFLPKSRQKYCYFLPKYCKFVHTPRTYDVPPEAGCNCKKLSLSLSLSLSHTHTHTHTHLFYLSVPCMYLW